MKRRILSVAAMLMLVFAPAALPLSAHAAGSSAPSTPAACSGSGNAAKDAVLGGVGDVGGKCDGTGATGIFKLVVNVLSILAGALAVIMVIISGFKYITSAGDPNKVASAKNTLVYALVGIAVAALAQTLVHFVINKASA